MFVGAGEERTRTRGDSGRGRLAPGLGGFGGGVLEGNEDLAQDVQITAQHGELQVSQESAFTPVAATHQAVARLQSMDRGFDARMPAACLTELDRRLLVLLTRLLAPGHGKTSMGDDLCQPALVLRRVKAAVEGRLADASLQTPLQGPGLCDDHVAVVRVAR